MRLVAIPKIILTSIPGAVMCYCRVNHGTDEAPEIEDEMTYAYDPNDLNMGEFGRSVGAWLEANEGNYTIEEAE